MTISINGIAHIQLTVNNPEACVPFWEKLCHFMEMKTLLRILCYLAVFPGYLGPKPIYEQFRRL